MIGNIVVPKYDDLIVPTVNALKALGGSASGDEIHDQVVEDLQLPDDVVEFVQESEGASTKLRYRLHWARTYLKKAGAANNATRGIWTLTPKGYAMTEQELLDIPRQVRALNRQSRRANENSIDDAADDPDSGELEWKDQLLAALLAMSPDAFERLCQRILRESGFIKVEVTGRSGDGGIDGHGILRVRLVSFQVLFQSKRWQGAVGSSVIRDFRGAMMGRADKGLIITTGRFTADARAEATRDGAPAIDLIDGEDLCELLKELRIGTRVEMVEQVEVDPSVFQSM